MEKVVITITGQDRTGIVANISNILAKNNVNILDIRQSIMDDLFTMIMLVDISTSTKNFMDIEKELNKTGEEIGVKVIAQHENIFKYMHRI
ncbi:ACT domain-containing protein [Methanococcus aeolicus]|uniref:ACT domain-containing protein n=1 Tax=Methanococcus aeolicus TaxID=42879 RepID=UPI0021C805C4|nr:ACT domain-containing protein [Methanococcus aeolicus]UXM84184.1 ACT domain-containing protein [Methanococcus aeolicus]